MQGWVIIAIALAYVLLLFAVASIGDRRAAKGLSARRRPTIYALSLAVYCTSWTFFGSVGMSASRGFEFLGIYTGPLLVFTVGYPLVRHIVRLSKSERITSIADFLAARYGKSFAVASLATLIATVGTIPYIALQLKAVAGSVELLMSHYSPGSGTSTFVIGDASLIVTALLAVFAILFGTRHADATEHQNGLILAVAVESIVKLAAFLTIGLACTFFLFGSPAELAHAITTSEKASGALNHVTSLETWTVLTVLSGCAALMLPRQFHVTIVENRSEEELRTAFWLFPLYLVLINLFVMPIGLAGVLHVGAGAPPDLYVLALPLSAGAPLLTLITFVGGLSAATAMVIVACVALSIMISNDLVIPLALRRFLQGTRSEREDLSAFILNIRRASIVLILFASFIYYRQAANSIQLASIGLLSFAAIAQFAPAFLGGLIWRGGNGRGAVLGMALGFAVWSFTLLLPTLAPAGSQIVQDGLFGLGILKPQALFGFKADPLTNGVFWSLAVNTLFYVLGSMSRLSTPIERIQATIFVPRDVTPVPALRRFRTTVTIDELKTTISRYLGLERTERAFQAFEKREFRRLLGNAAADMAVIRFSEQLLGSAVGSSSARLVLSLLFQRNDASTRNAIKLLDDASTALQENRDLLQIALDQMDQGITVFDEDFRLTCWNGQFRALLNLPEELGRIGIALTEILAHLAQRGDIPEGSEAQTIERMTMADSPWRIELKRNGRIIEIRSNPMPAGGIVATYTDVTASVEADRRLKRVNETLEQRVEERTAELTRVNRELARAQLEAEEANLGKTRFLAAAGHDILQPLNAARLYSSSLMERLGQSEEARLARNTESSLDAVESILGAVLDISRLDAGAMKPNPQSFRLYDLMQQVATDFAPLAREKGLRLRVVPSSATVSTDRNLLRRLVQNLVSNAIKYSRTGGVLIGVRRRPGHLELQVIDTGIGIPADKADVIFREFERLEEGAREAEGLGLGLSIVHRIARVLDLPMRLASIPGKGSVFSVDIRSAETPAAKEVVSAAPAGGFGSLAGLPLICIDNDARILAGMQSLVEGWGCRIATAQNGESLEALLRAPPLVPAVVLADYHLGNETGLDMIARVRARFGADLPAVLITADRSSEVREAAKAADVVVLNKPLKPAALRTILSRHRGVAVAAE